MSAKDLCIIYRKFYYNMNRVNKIRTNNHPGSDILKLNKYFKVWCMLCCVFLLVSLFAACTKTQLPTNPQPTGVPLTTVTPTPTANTVSDFIPLKVGNSWKYEGQGNEYAAYTQKVIYEAGNKYQAMYDNGGTVLANVFEVKPDSIVNTYREAEVYDNKNVLEQSDNKDIIVLKAPLQVGTTWVSEDVNYAIADMNASVTVPAGTFTNCMRVHLAYKDNSSLDIYYKKGVGPVLSEFKSANGDVVASKLTEYNIVK